MYHQLEKEQESNRALKMLTAAVSHEMLGPLNANVQFSERLLELTDNKKQRKMIMALMNSSKLLILHSNDLLDKSILENGELMPNYQQGSVYDAILEIAQIAEMLIGQKDLQSGI